MRRHGTLAAQALAFALAAAWLATNASAEPKYSEWGPAINVDPTCQGINSSDDDAGPGISKDGRSLYFGSTRKVAGVTQGFDLWVAKRKHTGAPWDPPVHLRGVKGSEVNSTGTDNVATLTRDGHWMFFNSNRTGSVGSVDIWLSYRRDVQDDFAWETPFNAGSINTSGFDGGATYFANKRGAAPQLFYGSGGSLASTQIWVAELLPDSACGQHPCFGNAHAVEELKSGAADQRPSIRFDGLEMFFSSNRLGSIGLQDIWVTSRNSIEEPWGPPTRLVSAGDPALNTTVNTTAFDMSPNLSADGLTLYFASNRAGGCLDAKGNPTFDIWMTTRTRLNEDQKEEDEDDERTDSD
jgi:Tol biopolymer transport system component